MHDTDISPSEDIQQHESANSIVDLLGIFFHGDAGENHLEEYTNQDVEVEITDYTFALAYIAVEYHLADELIDQSVTYNTAEGVLQLPNELLFSDAPLRAPPALV